jgi:hypothetical protein
MSRYTADIVSEKGVLEQDLLFLATPVTPQVLLKKISAVLGKQA